MSSPNRYKMQSRLSEISDVIKGSISIPGSGWKLHPAVPLRMIKRHPRAQRASVLRRLKRAIAGEGFIKDKAGLPRIVPNNGHFYAVTGATRTELAIETSGGHGTIPCEVWPTEQTEQQMAEFFLDELRHVVPGIGTKHDLALVAKRRDAKLVQNAIQKIPGANKSVGCFYFILKMKAGEVLLEQTVREIVKTWPKQALSSQSVFPGSIVRGVALLLRSGRPVARKFRVQHGPRVISPVEVQKDARLRKTGNGGRGTISSHVADVLAGNRRRK